MLLLLFVFYKGHAGSHTRFTNLGHIDRLGHPINDASHNCTKYEKENGGQLIKLDLRNRTACIKDISKTDRFFLTETQLLQHAIESGKDGRADWELPSHKDETDVIGRNPASRCHVSSSSTGENMYADANGLVGKELFARSPTGAIREYETVKRSVFIKDTVTNEPYWWIE